MQFLQNSAYDILIGLSRLKNALILVGLVPKYPSQIWLCIEEIFEHIHLWRSSKTLARAGQGCNSHGVASRRLNPSKMQEEVQLPVGTLGSNHTSKTWVTRIDLRKWWQFPSGYQSSPSMIASSNFFTINRLWVSTIQYNGVIQFDMEDCKWEIWWF